VDLRPEVEAKEVKARGVKAILWAELRPENSSFWAGHSRLGLLRKHGAKVRRRAKRFLGLRFARRQRVRLTTLGPAPGLFRRHEALQLLVDVLDDDELRRRAGRVSTGSLDECRLRVGVAPSALAVSNRSCYARILLGCFVRDRMPSLSTFCRTGRVKRLRKCL
jgi:hypothetical protein